MIFLALAVVFNACKKDEKGPVLNTAATVVPTWVDSPAPDTYYKLEKDSADVDLTTLSWTEVVYDLANLPSPLYTVQVLLPAEDPASSTWRDPVEILTLSELTYTMTVGDLNTAIIKEIGNEFPEDTILSAGFRIVGNVNANDVSNTIDAFSEIAPFTVTPYTTLVKASPLYLIGAATSVGWNNADTSLPFSYDEANQVYKIVATLDPAGEWYKAFEVPGQWAPQWGTGDGATWETGPLVYRPTEDVEDPPALPAPPELGDYLVTFDLVNEVYTVEVADLAQTMHVIGDASEAGWDNTQAIPMTKTAPGIFEIETTLSADATEGFKFLVNQGAWAPMYGSVEGTAFEAGVLVYRETEGDPDPKSIPPPATTGLYKIVVNIVGMNYTVTPM